MSKNGAKPSFLQNQNLRLLLFGGKGGVGKTTCATATALHLALNAPKASFILISTDPAHSLNHSLNTSLIPSNLKILELNSQEYLMNFKSKHNQKLREIASRGTFLDDEDISKFLDLSLPGLDELIAFFEISELVEKQSYECVIVDTAPTGHTLRLLSMPDILQKWLYALDALLAKHRYMKKVFTGSYHKDDLDNFLQDMAISVKNTEKILQDSFKCYFVPVMIAETLSICETFTLLNELKKLKISICDIVVNRLYPANSCAICNEWHARQNKELKQIFSDLSGYLLWGVPQYHEEVCGLTLLRTFWNNIVTLNKSLVENNPDTRSNVTLPKVKYPAKKPSPDTKFLFFAGKGGVGKTTLACATAMELASNFKGKKIFLFSTDPAHSLSDCLGVQIGTQPTQLLPFLTAMAIDAHAEFEALKTQYEKDLRIFLESLLPNLDLTFDREVMEKILDLSPSGLDEIMALTQAMEFLEKDNYDIFILDTAPTGHLIRLLELPSIIDQWLKVFFGLFLKYKNIFQLPNISQKLVKMSKNLKSLRRLLNDPVQSNLYCVSILTKMALEETKNLVATCERLKINVPVIFLNLVTEESECPICSGLHKSESNIYQEFCKNFPEKHFTLVYRQGESCGLTNLRKLGQILYNG